MRNEIKVLVVNKRLLFHGEDFFLQMSTLTTRRKTAREMETPSVQGEQVETLGHNRVVVGLEGDAL